MLAFFASVTDLASLVAFSMGLIVLGAAIAVLPPRPVPSKGVLTLLKDSALVIEAILEELAAEEKAIFRPFGDDVYSIVPLVPGPLPQVEGRPKSLIASGSGDALVIPALGEGIAKEAGIEGGSSLDSISTVVVDIVEAASSCRVAKAPRDRIVVELDGVRAEVDAPRFLKVFGGLVVSLAATAIAKALDEPVRISSVYREHGRVVAVLEVLGG